jgi:shingomyelin synthase
MSLFNGAPLPLLTQALRYPVVLLITVFILAIALNVTTERMPDPAKERPLPDMGHELLPKVAALEHVTDAILGIMNGLIIFMVFKLYLLHRHATGQADVVPMLPNVLQIPYLTNFIFGVWEGSKDGNSDPFGRKDCHYVAWIRFWLVYSILTLFRAPVIMFTSMPATNNHCQNPPNLTNPIGNVFLTVATLGSGSIHCGDLMFSGHSVSATLAFISLATYGPMLWWIFRPLGFTLMAATWVTILSSRSHYTDDIVVAIYLTIATYWLVPHNTPIGAPLSLQTIIRWWPCCGHSARQEGDDGRELDVNFVDVADTSGGQQPPSEVPIEVVANSWEENTEAAVKSPSA